MLGLSGLGFAAYSMMFGLRGLGLDLSQETYLYTPGRMSPNLAVFSHMVLGGLIMLLAPLQLIGRVRAGYPRLHRITGRVVVAGSIVTALGGLGYIALRGTIAGPLMDAGFALYGGLLLLAAVQVLRLARAGDTPRHRAWALRLIVLIMGSLIFRLHYTIWYLATGGLWSTEALDGPFDQVNYVAFYLPYLAMLEFRLRRRAGAHRVIPSG
jgi:hypothetical protein